MKKKTLVLGASLNPTRYSNIAINRLVAKNIHTVAFGLKEGDVIVAKGAGKLRPGAEIKPQEVPFDSIAKPVDQLFQ